MKTSVIRQKLMAYVADAYDELIKALYTLLKTNIEKENDSFEFSDEQMQILDEEHAKHLRGEEKSYTKEDAHQIARGKRDF